MSNSILTEEIPVVQVVQNSENERNKAETIETKNLDQNNVVIRICDLDNTKIIRDDELEYKVKDNYNLKTDISKTKALYGQFDSNQVIYLQKYWVQFNFSGGSRIPDGGGPPLHYDSDRNVFVRIVFAILLIMLIVTAGFVAFVHMTELKTAFLRHGMIILVIGMIGMFGLNYSMMCFSCTRTAPCNITCLFLAVIFMSMIAGYITARFRTQILLQALLVTTIVVIVCLCLACTSFDFTRFWLYVVAISVAFTAVSFIIGVTMLVTGTRYTALRLAILIIGCIINVVILTMELQMILGGGAVELSEDDYALGAFMLYTCIIDIFLRLVQILGIFDADYD